jgi:membrane-associated phospholipid phosphatase
MSAIVDPVHPSARPLPRRQMSATGAGVAAVLIVASGYLVYRGFGALTGDVEAVAVANAERIDRLQRALGIDVERSVQDSWLAQGTTGALLTWFYAVGYWPSIVVALVASAVLDRAVLRRFGVALALSGAVGLVVITAFPLAPPRLVGGADDHVARSEFLSTLAHPSAVFNPYAAMPSFHVAWTLLAALAAARLVRDRRFAAIAVWCLPVSMSIAVVTTGNHWVLDIVAGAVLAAVAWWAAPVVLDVLHRNIRGPTPAMSA